MLLDAARPYDAERLVERAVARQPDSAAAHALRAEVRTRLDWMAGSLEASERSLALCEDRELRLSLIRRYLEFNFVEGAERLATEGVGRWAEDQPLRILLAEALLAKGEYTGARAAVGSLPRSSDERIRILLACGDLEAVIADAGDHAEGMLARAQAAQWSGRAEQAREWAQRALALGAGAEAKTVVAVGELLAGRFVEAEAAVEAALEPDCTSPAPHIVQAYLASRRRDAEAAFRSVQNAMERAPGHVLALELISFARQRFDDGGYPANTLQDLTLLARRAPALTDESGRIDVDRAFFALSGNLTTRPTRLVAPGRAKRIDVSPDPMQACMDLRRRIRVLGFAPVIAEHDPLFARYENHPRIFTHRGELLLWSGRYREATLDFEAALAQSELTVWAYIGLALCQMLQENAEAALATLDRAARNTWAGPTTPLVRGEALRRLGHADQAREHLGRAVELAPGRISAWVNLALLELGAGRRPELRAALRQIIERAPSLVRDLAHDRGRTLPLDDPARLASDLEHTLTMMRGNRSSRMITYFTADGIAHVLDTRPSTYGRI